MARIDLQIVLSAVDNTRRSFGKLNTRLGGLRNRLENMQPAFRRMAFAGTAAFGALSFGIGKTIQEASRVQEIERLFDVTFNKTSSRVRKWAEDISNEFGRAEQDMLSLASTSGSVLAAAFDVPEEKLAELTTGMGEAALALSATDTRIETAQQAMEGFTQALIGNRQRVIDWGFQVRDAQLKSEALERGIIGVDEKLTAQQKAMLTAKLITEQVSISTQVLKDSQEDWSQIQQRLIGQIKEISAAIGGEFLPLVESLSMKLEPVLASVKGWVEENPTLARNILIVTAGVIALVTILGTLGILLGGIAAGVAALGGGLVVLKGILVAVALAGVVFLLTKIKDLSAGIVGFEVTWMEVWEKIKEGFDAVVDFLSDKILFVIDLIERIPKAIRNAAAVLLSSPFGGGFGQGLIGTASRVIGGVLPFADGGIVTGPTLGLVGEAGPEAVIPLNQANGLGGITINIQGGTFLSENAAEDFGDMLVDVLKRHIRI